MPKLSSKESAFVKLTTKQQLFVTEYIVDFNATRAALESGSPIRSAQVIGAQLLANPKVGMAIAEALRPLMKEAELTAQNVLKQLHDFLFFDITPYIDGSGFLRVDIKELPANIRQCIVGIKGHRHYDQETGEVDDERMEIKLVSKDAALKLAMQYLRLLEPDTNVNIKQQNIFTWDRFYEQAQQPLPLAVEGKIGLVVEGKVVKESTNGEQPKAKKKR